MGRFDRGSLLVRDGVSAGDEFGHAVSAADDVDGDGCGDVIVGARGAGGDTGDAYVYSGADGRLIRAAFGVASNDSYGSSVAGIGEVDGDDLSDVAVGTRDSDGGGWSNDGHA